MNIDERMHMLQVNIQSSHSNIAQLVEAGQISERRIDKVSLKIDKLAGKVRKLVNKVNLGAVQNLRFRLVVPGRRCAMVGR